MGYLHLEMQTILYDVAIVLSYHGTKGSKCIPTNAKDLNLLLQSLQFNHSLMSIYQSLGKGGKTEHPSYPSSPKYYKLPKQIQHPSSNMDIHSTMPVGDMFETIARQMKRTNG